MKLKEKMKNNNHKKFDKKKLVGTISKKHIKNGSYTMVMSVIFIDQHDRKCDSNQIFRN